MHVTAHAQPASSMTEMCVVEPSRLAQKPSSTPGKASPARNDGVRSDWASSIALASSTAVGAPSPRSSRASA